MGMVVMPEKSPEGVVTEAEKEEDIQGPGRRIGEEGYGLCHLAPFAARPV